MARLGPSSFDKGNKMSFFLNTLLLVTSLSSAETLIKVSYTPTRTDIPDRGGRLSSGVFEKTQEDRHRENLRRAPAVRDRIQVQDVREAFPELEELCFQTEELSESCQNRLSLSATALALSKVIRSQLLGYNWFEEAPTDRLDFAIKQFFEKQGFADGLTRAHPRTYFHRARASIPSPMQVEISWDYLSGGTRDLSEAFGPVALGSSTTVDWKSAALSYEGLRYLFYEDIDLAYMRRMAWVVGDSILSSISTKYRREKRQPDIHFDEIRAYYKKNINEFTTRTQQADFAYFIIPDAKNIFTEKQWADYFEQFFVSIQDRAYQALMDFHQSSPSVEATHAYLRQELRPQIIEDLKQEFSIHTDFNLDLSTQRISFTGRNEALKSQVEETLGTGALTLLRDYDDQELAQGNSMIDEKGRLIVSFVMSYRSLPSEIKSLYDAQLEIRDHLETQRSQQQAVKGFQEFYSAKVFQNTESNPIEFSSLTYDEIAWIYTQAGQVLHRANQSSEAKKFKKLMQQDWQVSPSDSAVPVDEIRQKASSLVDRLLQETQNECFFDEGIQSKPLNQKIQALAEAQSTVCWNYLSADWRQNHHPELEKLYRFHDYLAFVAQIS